MNTTCFDILRLPPNAKVAIYGAGASGSKVLRSLEEKRSDCQILFFIDSFKAGHFENKLLVKLVDLLETEMATLVDFILVASCHAAEIIDNLAKAGITKQVKVDPYYWNYNEKDWELPLYKETYSDIILDNARFYNIGAGAFLHPYWTNIDYVQKHYAETISTSHPHFINYDLMSLNPLPIEDGTAEVIYSAHTLEHITPDSLTFILSEIHRSLKEGGVFRLVLPNIDLFYRAFTNNDTLFFNDQSQTTIGNMFISSFASSASKQKRYEADEIKSIIQNLGYEAALDQFTSLCSAEGQRENPGGHINWFTPHKTKMLLKEAGFNHVNKCAYGQSSVAILRNIKLFDNSHPSKSLYFEAVK